MKISLPSCVHGLVFARLSVMAALVLVPQACSFGQTYSILEPYVPPGESPQQVADLRAPAAEELPLPASEFKTDPATESDSTALIQIPANVIHHSVMHEAFATVGQPTVPAGAITPLSPPRPIVEKPAAPKTQGTNRRWVPGYWHLSSAGQQFVWISGFYREVPPSRHWVAGQWITAPGGHQWSSGFWAQDGAELVVVPPPPESDGYGPTAASSNPAAFWLPGGQVYQNEGYHQQAGFWAGHQDKFLWQPATYVQREQGYVFVSGYWDFELALRGTPNATLEVDITANPGGKLTPFVAAARPTALTLHLFIRPNDSRVYLGDFYDPQLQGQGFLAWHDPAASSYSTSAWQSYYGWKSGKAGMDFAARTKSLRERLVSRPELRPQAGSGGVALRDSVTDSAANVQQWLSAGSAPRAPAAAITHNQAPAGRKFQVAPDLPPGQDRPSNPPPTARARQGLPATSFFGPGGSVTLGPGGVRVQLGIPAGGLPGGFVPPGLRLPIPAVGPAGIVPGPFPGSRPFGPAPIRRGRFGR